MEDKAKYFPQTLAALQSLQETAAVLEEAARDSVSENRKLKDKISNLRIRIDNEVSRIDAVINNLSGAAK